MGRCLSLPSEGLLHAHGGRDRSPGDGVTPRMLRRLGVPPRPGSHVDRELGTAVWGVLGLARRGGPPVTPGGAPGVCLSLHTSGSARHRSWSQGGLISTRDSRGPTGPTATRCHLVILGPICRRSSRHREVWALSGAGPDPREVGESRGLAGG